MLYYINNIYDQTRSINMREYLIEKN